MDAQAVQQPHDRPAGEQSETIEGIHAERSIVQHVHAPKLFAGLGPAEIDRITGLAATRSFPAGAVVLAVLARRRLQVTLVGGSLLQVLIIVSGVVLSVMYILGGIFALLWVTGIWLGHRVESSP